MWASSSAFCYCCRLCADWDKRVIVSVCMCAGLGSFRVCFLLPFLQRTDVAHNTHKIIGVVYTGTHAPQTIVKRLRAGQTARLEAEKKRKKRLPIISVLNFTHIYVTEYDMVHTNHAPHTWKSMKNATIVVRPC